MQSNTSIPKIMDSTDYTASLIDPENANDPIFLERALFLQDHGYFKDMTTLELRNKLRELYRRSEKLRITLENEDVWK